MLSNGKVFCSHLRQSGGTIACPFYVNVKMEAAALVLHIGQTREFPLLTSLGVGLDANHASSIQ